MIPLVPELRNTVIHLDVYLSHQRRVDPTLTRSRLQQQLRLTGKHQIMIKGSLVDVFGPVRAHINIDGADIYTSVLVTEAEAVSYTHLRAHETKANLVCRLLLEKKKK